MSSRIAWAMWTVAMALSVIALILLAATLDADLPDAWGFRGFSLLAAVAFGNVGLIIVTRRPNLIGWLFLVAGVAGAVQAFVEQYAIYGVLIHPGSLPGADELASVLSWIWVIGTFTVGVFVPLLFPDGLLPSPRWRPVAVLGFAAALLIVVGFALLDGPVVNATYVRNVFGVPGFPALSLVELGYAMWFVAGFAMAGSVVWRFRRSRGVARQQMKWLAYGSSLVAIGAVAGAAPWGGKAGEIFFIAVMGAVPASVTVAILRYRLYDIDLIINRTIVYGALSATLAGAYVAFVIVLQTLLRPVTGGSQIAVAASTLAVVALVQPLRGRIQSIVDRRFYRSRYDAARTLDGLATRLRDEVDLDAVRGEIVDVIEGTVHPRHASLWLRGQRP